MSRSKVWTICTGNQAIAAVTPHQQGLPVQFSSSPLDRARSWDHNDPSFGEPDKLAT